MKQNQSASITTLLQSQEHTTHLLQQITPSQPHNHTTQSSPATRPTPNSNWKCLWTGHSQYDTFSAKRLTFHQHLFPPNFSMTRMQKGYLDPSHCIHWSNLQVKRTLAKINPHPPIIIMPHCWWIDIHISHCHNFICSFTSEAKNHLLLFGI